MSFTHTPAGITWACDTTDCTAVVTTSFESDLPERYQLPADWCGVLMTSMSDGDYALLLCADCSGQIKDRVSLPDTMHNPTTTLVGW